MTQRQICVFTRTIYGTSGTELPPPPKARETFAVVQGEREAEAAFKARMQKIGMDLRAQAETQPCPPYGARDGWDWGFHPIAAPDFFARLHP